MMPPPCTSMIASTFARSCSSVIAFSSSGVMSATSKQTGSASVRGQMRANAAHATSRAGRLKWEKGSGAWVRARGRCTSKQNQVCHARALESSPLHCAAAKCGEPWLILLHALLVHDDRQELGWWARARACTASFGPCPAACRTGPPARQEASRRLTAPRRCGAPLISTARTDTGSSNLIPAPRIARHTML